MLQTQQRLNPLLHIECRTLRELQYQRYNFEIFK